MINNIVGLMFWPTKQWQQIEQKDNFSLFSSILYTLIMAMIPAFAWFYGTTSMGWAVDEGSDHTVRLTEESATIMVTLFYFTMVLSVTAIGYMIHWMSQTYGADSTLAKGVAIAGFSATPLFIAGAVGFIPLFWLSLILGVLSVSYAVYILYLGIPIIMSIPKERGFLFSSAVLAFCMVILMIIMGGTVILWDFGAAPVFTD